MTTYLPTLCVACQHRRDLTGRSAETGTCSSFPDGIPEEISVDGADHRTSRAGEEPFALDDSKVYEYRQWLAFQGEGEWPPAREEET